jgi:hypothetical protein
MEAEEDGRHPARWSHGYDVMISSGAGELQLGANYPLTPLALHEPIAQSPLWLCAAASV